MNALVAAEFHVQIETNGMLYPGDDFPWKDENVTVVCSPKTGKIHSKLAPLVHAYKYVLSYDAVAPDGMPETALAHPLGGGFSQVARPPEGWVGPIYVNPMDCSDERGNKKNLMAVVDSVTKNQELTMGIQLHKLIGLP